MHIVTIDELIPFQSAWTTKELIYSFVIHRISEITLTTSCEVCIVGSDSNNNIVLSTKVSFSFGKCIACLLFTNC